MKLELKHLAPYLPYGLQIKFNISGEISTLEYINAKRSFVGTVEEESQTDEYYSCDNIKNIKPILHPLSDLTKEIELNGERFVPLIELAKIAYPKSRTHNLMHGKNEHYVDIGGGYSFHVVKEKLAISFDCRRGYNNEKWDYNCFVPEQLQLFQKLYSCHFAINIPENLYININYI